MYYYVAYGLNISSELEIDELVKVDYFEENEIDVHIKLENNFKKIEKSKIIHKSKNKIIMELEGVAKYTIEDGKYIIVDQCGYDNAKDVISFLLSWSFGYLFIQKGIMALHASAILVNDRAIAIAGDTEAGKSTLANKLANKGYKFISDDLSIIDLKLNEKPIIKPSIPVSKIRHDMIEKLGYKTEDKNDDERLKVNMADKIVDSEMDLGIIVHLEAGNVSEVSIEEVTGESRIKIFLDNIYFIDVVKQFGMNPMYFKKCLNIVNNIKIYKMIRPINQFTVNEQVKLIENIC